MANRRRSETEDGYGVGYLAGAVAIATCLLSGLAPSSAWAGPPQDNSVSVVTAKTGAGGQQAPEAETQQSGGQQALEAAAQQTGGQQAGGQQTGGQQAGGQQSDEEEADETASSDTRRGFYWDDGVRFALDRLNVHIAGMAENDSAAFVGVTPELEDRVGAVNSGVEWRRARLFVRGNFFERFDFNLEYDFAVSSPPNLKNAYVGIRFDALVIGNWRIHGGRFQTPLSLEGFTHNTDTTFMERATVSAFFPDRNTGILLQGDISRISSKFHWNVGFTYPEDELGTKHDGNGSLSGRFTYAFNPRDGDVLVHAGIDYLQDNVDPKNPTVRIASQPEAHLAPIFVDTGDIPAINGSATNLEVALVKGPLSLQGEYVRSRVAPSDEPGSLSFYAFYAYASYVLTGETRPYDQSRGSFERIVPKTSFMSPEGGRGAFEVAFRFSRLDLTDKQVHGGVLDDFTAALNWYASRKARVSTNVIRSKLDGADPVWIFQVRLQWAY